MLLSDRFMVCCVIFLVAFAALFESVRLFQLTELGGWDTFKMVASFLAFVFWSWFGFAVYKRLEESWSVSRSDQ